MLLIDMYNINGKLMNETNSNYNLNYKDKGLKISYFINHESYSCCIYRIIYDIIIIIILLFNVTWYKLYKHQFI